MTLPIHADSVPLRVDGEGDVRVGQSRVLLDLVVHAFQNGATPEAIVQSYATLRLADVYGVVAYYLRHQEEVDSYLRDRERQGDEVLSKIAAAQGDLTGIRERLLARREEARHAAAGRG